MKTPITYYGGKSTLASTIIGMMPAHKVYCEPYFGGGAVFFAKGKSYVEVINDINDNLITFYLQLQNNYEELCKLVSQTLCSESQWIKARDIWNGTPASDVMKAWAVWVVTNFSYAGSPAAGWKWDNGNSGTHAGRGVLRARDQFTKSLQDRLSEVQISCRDGLSVIQQRDSVDTFFYIDPPYLYTDCKHYGGWDEGCLEALLHELSGIKGKFILSQFSSSLLSKYIKRNGWNVKEVELPCLTGNLKGKKSRKRELLVYNYTNEPTLF